MTQTTRKQPILLDITGRYGVSADAPATGHEWADMSAGKVGWQDEDGVEHFNDRITSPFGWVGNMKTHVECDDDGQLQLVIDAAPSVILVSTTPVEEWPESKQVGASIETSPFGFRIFELAARNGTVRYVIKDDEVRWADLPDEETHVQIATLIYGQWRPEGPPPPRLTTKTVTKLIQEAT